MPKSASNYFTLFLIIVSGSIISCTSSNKKEKQLITALEESLISSNECLNMSSWVLLRDLEDKTTEPWSKERAEKWYAIATRIAKKSKEVFDFLEKVKKTHDFNTDTFNVIRERLYELKQYILRSDSSLIETFQNTFGFINHSIVLLGADTSQENGSFTELPPDHIAIAVLNQLQNEIKKTEYKTIAFCNTKICCQGLIFDNYFPIIGQNSKVFNFGEFIEITAALGAISKAAKPVIQINGSKIPLNQEGYSFYKKKVSTLPGKHKIPVSISYVSPITGTEELKKFDIEYTVAKPCNDQ